MGKLPLFMDDFPSLENQKKVQLTLRSQMYSLDLTIFFQISSAFGPNAYQIMYGETLDVQ